MAAADDVLEDAVLGVAGRWLVALGESWAKGSWSDTVQARNQRRTPFWGPVEGSLCSELAVTLCLVQESRLPVPGWILRAVETPVLAGWEP